MEANLDHTSVTTTFETLSPLVSLFDAFLDNQFFHSLKQEDLEHPDTTGVALPLILFLISTASWDLANAKEIEQRFLVNAWPTLKPSLEKRGLKLIPEGSCLFIMDLSGTDQRSTFLTIREETFTWRTSYPPNRGRRGV
jgi:hypothetical protein